MTDVTRILSQIEDGDPSAAEQLLPLIYDELRRLAASKMSQESPGQTLQPTALVHEAYLRLVDAGGNRRWDSRGHFFAAAGEAMRRILIERARINQRHERLGGTQIPLDDLADVSTFSADNLLNIDEALQRLESLNPLAARLVKLRFFAGLSMSDVAAGLGIPLRTAERTWTYARIWLHREFENLRHEKQ